MQGVILAGGRGTRLKEITGDLPKPLIDIDGKPLLLRQLELLRAHGIGEALILTGYGSEIIKTALAAYGDIGMRLGYGEEDEKNPLGTAGALLNAFDRLNERIVVLYGDCMMNVDLTRMVHWHMAQAADASLLVHPNDHPHDSDLVEVDAQSRVTAFHPYPHPPGAFLPNLVNAALYVIETPALAPFRASWLAAPHAARRHDIAKQLFPGMLRAGARLYGYRSPEYIKDAGTPERYAKVVRDLRSGRIARSSLTHPQKAIFLDRDGTLNEDVDRVKTPEELRLIDGVAAALHRINESEYRAIVITNQPVLARGDCDAPTLARIHAKLDTLLGQEGAYLDALYYCPHHPHRGYEGEVPELKIDCDCRKPKPGMLLAAQADLNIDFSQSWFIGDTTIDIRTAKSLGIRAVLVRSGKAGQDGSFPDRPDFTFGTLAEAVDEILARHTRLVDYARAVCAQWSPGDRIALTAEGEVRHWLPVVAEACAGLGLAAGLSESPRTEDAAKTPDTLLLAVGRPSHSETGGSPEPFPSRTRHVRLPSVETAEVEISPQPGGSGP